MLNETIQYYSSNGAKHVYLLLVDASKAFDKVSFSLCLICYLSTTLAQWGERSLSERTAQVLFPVRPDKTYTVFCCQECPYKMNVFRDYSVYLCI